MRRSTTARVVMLLAILATTTCLCLAQEETVVSTEVPVIGNEPEGEGEERGTSDPSGNPRDCRWGEHCPDDAAAGGTVPAASTTTTASSSSTATTTTPEHNADDDNTSHVDASAAAFLKPPSSRTTATPASTTTTTPSSSTTFTGPPEGFVVTARVYTDPDDKLAHFDDDTYSSTTLPYWECGAAGSTTFPLSVKHAYFRHALGTTRNDGPWSGTEYGPHPQLLIPLSKPLELILNSGEHRSFAPGAVILLEDVLSAGHKLKAVQDDMVVLLLTLPQHYHHVGKDRVSLLPASGGVHTRNRQPGKRNQGDPCPDPWLMNDGADASVASRRKGRAAAGIGGGRLVTLLPETIRKVLFGSIGLGVSSLVAVFLGKVAPLWLSVGVGGTCFVLGGTYATMTCGEYVTQEMEVWYERRRLKVQRGNGESDVVMEEDQDSATRKMRLDREREQEQLKQHAS